MSDTISVMGFYSRYCFPCLCDFALDNPIVGEQRRQLLTLVEGSVLEIGFGTGLNLPFYPRQIRQLTAVDPNPGMSKRAQNRIRKSGIEVHCHQLRSEHLPFNDNSYDCIVSTFTLCSIQDVSPAMREVFRVLKPGGKFVFLEHGLSPDSNIERWQRRINGIQRWFGGGCSLIRNMKEIVSAQPFTVMDTCEMYLDEVPRTHGYIYRGVARK